MTLYNRTVYATLNLLRNKNSIKLFNFMLNNENSNLILPKLYSVFSQETKPIVVINKTATIYFKLFFIIVGFIKLI
jgi:hypothetical protein